MPIIKKQTLATPKPVPSGGVLDRLSSGWSFVESFSILLYGKSGSGKTTLWSTFPKPILAIICSGGKHPGELMSINTPEMKKCVVPRVVSESTDIRDLIEAGKDFATVVLDHASGLQDLVLKEILGLEELPAQRSWGLASQSQYGQCTMQCKEILRALLSLSANRVVIAQEQTRGEQSDNELLSPTVCAAMMPSLVSWLNPAADYVCQTYIRPKTENVVTEIGGKKITTKKRGKGVEYCLRVEPHDIYTTKFRKPKGRDLPECIIDPSYQKIKALINGEK
jgi:hypothetical protein